tara:strand:+ start:2618 stop:2851 length:234 start_codon:yes stop_codon:yes gene_type:complete
MDIDKSQIDDSYITNEDKKLLLQYIKNIYINKHQWADETLQKCLIMNHYNEVIKKMNKEEYLQEKQNLNTNDILNQI